MNNKSLLTKILAIIGSVLVWLPILAPVILSIIVFIRERLFLFDYLMPAELFPIALVGGGLLVWAAIRAQSRRRLIGWSFGIALLSLAGGQALAVVSGLATSSANAAAWVFPVAVGTIVLYSLALIVTGIGGVLLVRDLYKPG